MNIVERAKGFVESLLSLARRSAWDWRRCPKCGGNDTIKYGKYRVRLWYLTGRGDEVVGRHKCKGCGASGRVFTYSEQSAYRVRGSWYAREVHRLSVDYWQHGRSSLRRTAEFVRSHLGHQERWLYWRVLDSEPSEGERCHLAASTVHRWLDGAGREGERTVKGQLEGVPSSGQIGVDGLWAVVRGRAKRVILVVVDSVSGLIHPPVAVTGEESEESWEKLFAQAVGAGLSVEGLRGVTSDGASGLVGYLGSMLWWVNHQCLFHLWRNLGGELRRRALEAAGGLVGEAAATARRETRRELARLVRAVVDARSDAEAKLALATLRAHRLGVELARRLEEHLDATLVYLSAYNRGLLRVGPEWVWRDFRLRVSRGRNHGSDERLERAALVWQIYSNFEPAQRRSERKRHYKRPGKCCLDMAGAPPGNTTYLDALAV